MNPKVLIVDDETSVCRLLSRVAEDLGCEVRLASDGAEAVTLAGEFFPDLVLMDLHMPGLDGLEALREILESSPGVRVLVVTGDSADRRVRAALESGAADYIMKPFTLARMRDAMEQHLLCREFSA